MRRPGRARLREGARDGLVEERGRLGARGAGGGSGQRGRLLAQALRWGRRQVGVSDHRCGACVRLSPLSLVSACAFP